MKLMTKEYDSAKICFLVHELWNKYLPTSDIAKMVALVDDRRGVCKLFKTMQANISVLEGGGGGGMGRGRSSFDIDSGVVSLRKHSYSNI